MLTTTQDSKLLSNVSYWIDTNKSDKPFTPLKGEILDTRDIRGLSQNFQVLQVEDNQANGMQAMAVAPVVNGVVDYDNVTIAYAGTNFGDAKDRQTDLNSVIGGQNYFETAPQLPSESQVDSALAFAAEIRRRYPQAKIDTTGHSLGGYLGQMVAIKNQWAATTFNAPNPSNMLTKDEIAWAKANTDILVSYRNEKDWIGNYGGDPLGIARAIAPYKENDIEGLDSLHHHGLSTWQFDKHGNLVDKYGLVVDKKNYYAEVDINSDGVEDITLSATNTTARNLFLSSGSIGLAGSQKIEISPDTLRMLSSNLNLLALTEIPAMIKACQLCQEKNEKIKGDFETRKQKVEESIVQHFKETRLTEVFYRMHESVGQLVSKRSIFEQLASPKMLRNTIPHPAYFSSGAYLELSPYNSTLSHLSSYSQTLSQQASSEQSSGFILINPTPSVLKSSDILEETAKNLKKKSEIIFEGTGLREGKKDGISDSLSEVLNIEQANLAQLSLAVENVAQMTLGLADHFQTMDDWLGSQIQSGGSLEGLTIQNVPRSYQAYLEETGIFDDVKDVLQAFDEQVERKSATYAKDVSTGFSTAFQSVQSSLERWSNQLENFNQSVSSIKSSFEVDIYIDRKTKVDKGFKMKREYWGNLSRLYDSNLKSSIRTANKEIKPLTEKLVSALEITKTAQSDLQNMKPQLKAIIEEGVYVAFDLDEIVASQKVIQQQTARIGQELSYVIDTLTSQMSGEAISTLSLQLSQVRTLTGYFNQLVGECFGNQDSTLPSMPSGVISPQAKNFSLNPS
ncbi:TPA: hypothetical protein ACGO5M_002152 [Streptococcus suis]